MPADCSVSKGSKLEQESLLPELLHALNQPLTSLRCSLELTLLQPRDSEEYRKRLRESLKLTEDITVLAGGIRELIEVEQPVSRPQPVRLDRILQSSIREVLPLADAQGVAVSLVCAPSLTMLGDIQQISTAIIYFLSFFLNVSSKGEEVSVQANPDAAEIALVFELSRRRGETPDSQSKIPEKPGTAKAYLRLLVARRIFEVAGGTVYVEHGARQVAVRIRFPGLTSGMDEEDVLSQWGSRALAIVEPRK